MFDIRHARKIRENSPGSSDSQYHFVSSLDRASNTRDMSNTSSMYLRCILIVIDLFFFLLCDTSVQSDPFISVYRRKIREGALSSLLLRLFYVRSFVEKKATSFLYIK